MNASRPLARLAALIAALMLLTGPAMAHKEHKKQAEAAAAVHNDGDRVGPAPSPGQTNPLPQAPDTATDPGSPSLAKRLIDWFGRLHPAIVHFPIAFFPAALFTAIVGRRRPAFAAPVQFLVVAGGIFAPVAAAAGWIAGAGAQPDAILEYHRWLGLATGLAAALLALWAWKRPWEDRGSGMIAALTLMTIAIVIQAFLGASVTHGLDHMMF